MPPVRVDCPIGVGEVVALEEEAGGERFFPYGFRLLVPPILSFLATEELT
jgi:hypothetical protein